MTSSSASKMHLSFLTDAADVVEEEYASSSSLASIRPNVSPQCPLTSLADTAVAFGAARDSSMGSESTVVSLEEGGYSTNLPTPRLTDASRFENECEICGLPFAQKLRFLYHRYAEHGWTTYADKRILPCTQCNAAFLRKTDLTKHVACVHERKRPHKCAERNCSSSFFFRKDLAKHHSTVHEKNRPFQCGICNNRFGKKEHLTSHIRRVHHKLKPFRCDLCDIKLASKYNLQGHLRTLTHATAQRNKSARRSAGK